MFNIILQVLAYAKILITFSLFTYIYKYFYDNCNEKKIIKSKDEKPKKVIKTRIGLSLMYLVLLILLYFSLTWYIFLTLLLATFTIVITLTHKFEPSSLDILKKYDSHPITKKIWYFYSLVMNIIFKIMGPCHRVLENKINKNKEIIKSGLIGQVSKMNFGGLNMGFLGSLSTFTDETKNSSKTTNVKSKMNSNKKTMVNDFNKIESFFKEKNDKSVKLNSKNQEQTSELNKYILEDSQTKTSKSNTNTNNRQNAKIMFEDSINDSINDFNNNTTNNKFAVVSDIEEPLDTILLNKQKSANNKTTIDKPTNYKNELEILDTNIEDFLTKMKTIEKKVNRSNIITIDDDLSSFINKTEIFFQDNDNNSKSDDNSSPIASSIKTV
jgi:hypothetical protein